MAVKLNVGVSKKLGMPEYSSVGASCNVEVELDPSLFQGDLAGFHERVRLAYVACHQAVHDELARLLNAPAPATPGRASHPRENGHPYPSGEPHLFLGRDSFDDGTTCVLISEERPWRGFGGRRRNGWG
jgi:hypothetical protein